MTLLLGLVCFQDEQIEVLPVTGISTVVYSGRNLDRFKPQVRDRRRL